MTLAHFYSRGTRPVDNEKLKRRATEGAALCAVCFSILAEIPSGPLDFDVSTAPNNYATSFSEHNKSSGKGIEEELTS